MLPHPLIAPLKLAIKQAITNTNTLLSSTPEELLTRIDNSQFTDPDGSDDTQDVCYVVSNLQEILNNLLDARKRMILLGFYGLNHAQGKTRESEVQIRAREEIPAPLEKDQDTNHDPTYIPSNTEMEI
jgi:hypothetical protein